MFLQLDEKAMRSFRLLQQCVKVLTEHKSLVLFPIVAAFFSGLAIAYFFRDIEMANETREHYSAEFLIASYYTFFAMAFFLTMAKACIVAISYYVLQHDPDAYQKGEQLIIKNIWHIITWSLFFALVGVLLSAGGKNKNIFQRFFFRSVALVWRFVAAAALPIIVIERCGVREGVARTTNLIKKTWGENIIGATTVSLFFSGFVYLIVFVFIVVGTTILEPFSGYLQASFVVGTLLLIVLIQTTLNTIFMTALYLYAVTGQVPDGFDEATVKSAFLTQSA